MGEGDAGAGEWPCTRHSIRPTTIFELSSYPARPGAGDTHVHFVLSDFTNSLLLSYLKHFSFNPQCGQEEGMGGGGKSRCHRQAWPGPTRPCVARPCVARRWRAAPHRSSSEQGEREGVSMSP